MLSCRHPLRTSKLVRQLPVGLLHSQDGPCLHRRRIPLQLSTALRFAAHLAMQHAKQVGWPCCCCCGRGLALPGRRSRRGQVNPSKRGWSRSRGQCRRSRSLQSSIASRSGQPLNFWPSVAQASSAARQADLQYVCPHNYGEFDMGPRLHDFHLQQIELGRLQT